VSRKGHKLRKGGKAKGRPFKRQRNPEPLDSREKNLETLKERCFDRLERKKEKKRTLWRSKTNLKKGDATGKNITEIVKLKGNGNSWKRGRWKMSKAGLNEALEIGSKRNKRKEKKETSFIGRKKRKKSECSSEGRASSVDTINEGSGGEKKKRSNITRKGPKPARGWIRKGASPPLDLHRVGEEEKRVIFKTSVKVTRRVAKGRGKREITTN